MSGRFPPLPRGWSRLVRAAATVRTRAYAPYSGFAVGAAFQGTDGRIYAGCNVENVSLGLTQCAERAAIASAIAAGCRAFTKGVVLSDSKKCISPCGACRQVLSEFCDELELLSVTRKGRWERLKLSWLLPRARTGLLD